MKHAITVLSLFLLAMPATAFAQGHDRDKEKDKPAQSEQKSGAPGFRANHQGEAAQERKGSEQKEAGRARQNAARQPQAQAPQSQAPANATRQGRVRPERSNGFPTARTNEAAGSRGEARTQARITRESRPQAFQHRDIRRVRAGAFHYPRGYSYRRWSVGARLPIFFISSPYFFSDYLDVGLEPPPYGYRWVRYGPDALLVDRYTGEVVDVAYDVFY